jgi:F420-non-reducing hydrogenase small subunit
VRDQGAKILSSICANVVAQDGEGIRRTLKGIPDPVGTFYRYGLANSILRRRVDLVPGGDSGKVERKVAGNGKQ